MIVNRQIQDTCKIKNDDFNLVQFSIDFVFHKLIWMSIIPIEPILGLYHFINTWIIHIWLFCSKHYYILFTQSR